MIISDHAYEEMHKSNINEGEVKQCLEHGKIEIKQIVNGEVRYGKKLELKNQTIVVIYTLRNNEERIITVYPIRRKKTWQKK
ncbi:MAG: DUF4258 domain-containing protein [Candidatus Nanoarchaeia archaeon]|nr:DUF4258 domain-containing protein [Candidatus Nanoarchaeia archaeon]